MLLFALPGAVLAWKAGRRNLVAVAALSITGVHALIACHNGWWGGWSTGPRYLIVCLPFWCLLLPRSRRLPGVARWVYFGCIALSVLNMIAIAAVEAMMQKRVANPLYGVIYPRLLNGRYPVMKASFNLGSAILGLPPRWDLLPFAIMVVMLGIWMWRLCRAQESLEPTEQSG